MAMNAAGMGAAIKTEILAIPGITITNASELDKFCNAVGKAVVEYIQANAETSVTTTCPAGSGSGTGDVS